MIKKHQHFFNKISVILDALILVAAYFVAYEIKLERTNAALSSNLYIVGSLWMIPLIIAVYFYMDVYSPMRSRKFRQEMLLILHAHLIGMVFIYSIFFLNKSFDYSREMLTLFGVLGALFILIERYVIRRTLRLLRKTGYNQKHMLIIGAGSVGFEFACKVQAHKDFGYNVVGFLDDDENKHGSLLVGKPVLGSCVMLPVLLENQSIDEVVVALPLNAHEKYRGIVNECEKAGVRIRIIPDYYKLLSNSPQIEEFDGIPLLNIRKIPLDDPLDKLVKRILDISISVVAIIITCPVMICIALGIKLTSPGPVFFRQQRVGLNNRPFYMLKFRTMHILDDTIASTTWTTVDDPRKTIFGSILRKTSLDELPQFFNVLLGNMSVVGPRPERPYFVDQFKEEVSKYMVKHQVKPGITGWAQVNGWRGDTSIEKRIECDIYYIENWNMLLDIRIMLATVFKGLVNKNAY